MKFRKEPPQFATQRRVSEYLESQIFYATNYGIQNRQIFINVFNSMMAYKTAFQLTEHAELVRMTQHAIDRLKIIAKRGGVLL